MEFNVTEVANSTIYTALTVRKKSTLEIVAFYVSFPQSTIYVACFLANLLTITAVVRYENLHKKPTNIIILSLSVADGILGKFDNC